MKESYQSSQTQLEATLTEYDSDYNAWECSNCEAVWSLSNPDSPLENNMRFCQSCGAKFVAYSSENHIDVIDE